MMKLILSLLVWVLTVNVYAHSEENNPATYSAQSGASAGAMTTHATDAQESALESAAAPQKKEKQIPNDNGVDLTFFITLLITAISFFWLRRRITK